MTDYNPPTEDLPIFDKLVFTSGDNFITQNQADKRYLRYPNAQGTENLQTINVNGVATFNDIIKSKEQLQLIDTTPALSTTECLIAGNSVTNNRLAFVLNPISGAYGNLCQANDNLIVSGDSNGIGTNQPLTIESWSTVTNGIRITDTDVTVGCGGTAHSPINRISFTQTSTNLYGPTNINNSIIMTGATGPDRQITCGYVNLSPVGGAPVATGTQIYQSTNASYWDNNVNGGIITFATNTIGGVQVIPLNLTSTYVETNLPFKINGLGNYLQFPDGTQQTTAAGNGKTYTEVFTQPTSTTYNIPANCTGISVKLVGIGGIAGANIDSSTGTTWNAGGSGGGASMCISQGIIPITSGSLTLNVGAGAGQPNFLLYNGITICTAYNGYDGLSATVTTGGAGAPAQTQGSGNTSICNWFIATGSAGTTGGTAITFQNCSAVPATAGKPSAILTTGTTNDTISGCGMRYFALNGSSVNKCPNSSPFPAGVQLTLTYYLK